MTLPVECCWYVCITAVIWFLMFFAFKIGGFHYGMYSVEEMEGILPIDLILPTIALMLIYILSILFTLAIEYLKNKMFPARREIIYLTREEAVEQGVPFVDVYGRHS